VFLDVEVTRRGRTIVANTDDFDRVPISAVRRSRS
jgi:hypothetical protein